MNSSFSLFKIHKKNIPLCHFRHGEIYSFPSCLQNYAPYSGNDFCRITKLVCLIPPHCCNYCFSLCVVQSSRQEAVRGFAQVEWSLTDSMAFTLNVNERVLGGCWSGKMPTIECALLVWTEG